jgi:allophanate hydrolase subunit 2
MSAPAPGALPEGAKAKLSVVKGLRAGKTYSLKEGTTYVGRMGPMAIDVDLTEQEMPGVSVQVNRFALIWMDKAGLGIADTGTRIGTTLNGAKIPKGKRFPLKADDTLQWGKTVLQVKVILKKRTAVQK